ncbi:hypothetical protein C2S51_014877 [Perilla frutescens var. frutescens]|nr:hypothetical protein C2S51_014877 [Perilla frutescens var. frutescens]
MAKRLCESDNTSGEEMKKFKVDHGEKDKSDDVVHPHQTTENPSPQEEGGFISDHDGKDKSGDVVNPHQTTKNHSPQEEGGGFPWCNYICLSGDEDEFDEEYPPIRHVEEFTDDYDLLAPYFLRFPFEDKEDFNYKRLYGRRGSKKAHQTILRYIKQIRESFCQAFDVDCRPPRWFHIARLKPIELTWAEGYFKSKSCEKAYMDFVDLVLEAAKVAVEDINYAIGFETSGKGYKFVGLEKGVTSVTYFVLFLTINVSEVEVANVTEDEGALRKTIQEDGAEGEGALRKRKIIRADGAGAEGEGALRKTIQADGPGGGAEGEGEGALRKTIQEDGAEGEGALRKRKIIRADGAGAEGEGALRKTIQADGAGAGAEGEGEGALRKTIQAIVSRNSYGIYQVVQWRMKPVP